MELVKSLKQGEELLNQLLVNHDDSKKMLWIDLFLIKQSKEMTKKIVENIMKELNCISNRNIRYLAILKNFKNDDIVSLFIFNWESELSDYELQNHVRFMLNYETAHVYTQDENTNYEFFVFRNVYEYLISDEYCLIGGNIFTYHKFKIHELKIEKQYMKQKVYNNKSWEIRKNDRNFKVGDMLYLREIDEHGKYTGFCMFQSVLNIFENMQYLIPNYVILTGDLYYQYFMTIKERNTKV